MIKSTYSKVTCYLRMNGYDLNNNKVFTRGHIFKSGFTHFKYNYYNKNINITNKIIINYLIIFPIILYTLNVCLRVFFITVIYMTLGLINFARQM